MPKKSETSDPTVTYLLRDVPEQIWRGARSRAILEGESIRTILIDFLAGYADRIDGGKFVGQPKRTARKKR